MVGEVEEIAQLIALSFSFWIIVPFTIDLEVQKKWSVWTNSIGDGRTIELLLLHHVEAAFKDSKI